ncbi:porphobilinogen synthase [Caldinitratiruptor microaerophilus]|uniref:Delta-aminolevulinic acid dehydratase n=1 Tax=Caldinitratiruptor microaerophilus TaxID=671077 RepID=A0AA35G6P0_9FIRM|nr:porphobilinogen synthase [Caldinitratiruptor microaerophilus]BDG59226.1 delta-aminolevulinic acid dehydratase [Caldinitratiruptor microaerophilus]
MAVESIRVGTGFPVQRPRRLRASETIRRLVQETRLGTDDLIYPLFVVPGTGVREEIDAMPGQYHLSVDMLLRRVEESLGLGVRACILFGIPEHKDATGSSAFDPQGPVQRAIREIKARFPEMYVITDVCLCEYTDHGHCGVVQDGRVANDPTLDLLAREALSHAEAGADMVAPSDMMDGRVAAIRKALDENGFEEIPIMAYSAKYASAYYGPFRVAAQSAPRFGDRRSYQMDPPNAREALKEVELDIAEGADIVMVKPALAYLDVLWRVKEATKVPVACYNVSGEYAMVKAAAQRGWIDERRVVLETLTGMKRAGADLILTYHALDVARWLREDA